MAVLQRDGASATALDLRRLAPCDGVGGTAAELDDFGGSGARALAATLRSSRVKRLNLDVGESR